jgi:acetylornithine deacetylase/succinyl-diaminopimelate desuccinylase-like protein
VRLKERKTPYLTPMITDKNDPCVKRLEKIIAAELGAPHLIYGNNVADENVLALSKVPVMIYGPSGANMHSAGEWVSKKSYLNITAILKKFIQS